MEKTTKPSLTPQVSIQKSTYENIDISSLMNPLGGLKNHIKKGEQVLLKPNLLNATEPEKAVITHPKLIEAVAIEVMDAGGQPIIGDSPSGPFLKRRLQKVYQTSGLQDLSKKLGIELNYDTSTKKIEIPRAKKIKKTKICQYILDADKIIALPKIKTHSLMIMTLATKIMFGAAPGLLKARYHAQYMKQPDFADMLLDILSIVPPHLIIMDGIIGMQGDGPMSGDPIRLDTILASDHPIAIDLAVCEMLSIEPMGIPVLKKANIRKLWPDQITYPLLSPDQVKHTDFILPSTAGYLLSEEKTALKSPVITNNCVACGECKEICPKNAITIKNKKAHIDYSKCIRCYCCHEVCRYHAIQLETIK